MRIALAWAKKIVGNPIIRGVRPDNNTILGFLYNKSVDTDGRFTGMTPE
jgi:hypothetical protein